MSNPLDGPAYQAFKDMAPVLEEERKALTIAANAYDYYIPGKSHVYTAESCRLNRELGLWGINKKGNINNFKKDLIV